MHIFYIPDGHRRYAKREKLSLEQVYEQGYRVLRDEVVGPLCKDPSISRIGVFLLSKLNLQKRSKDDLSTLLKAVERLTPRLCQDLKQLCVIRVVGGYYPCQATDAIAPTTGPIVELYIGSDTDDAVEGPTDLLVRSGGTLRLSGAPRALIGPYTEFQSLAKLHPEVRACDIRAIVSEFVQRYSLEGFENSRKKLLR